MCVCLSRQCTMRDSANTSYSSFQSGLFTIFNKLIIGKLQKISGSIRASFRKWFSNRNAPTSAYIDEPRPRRRSSSLAGKSIHPSYACLHIIIEPIEATTTATANQWQMKIDVPTCGGRPMNKLLLLWQ